MGFIPDTLVKPKGRFIPDTVPRGTGRFVPDEEPNAFMQGIRNVGKAIASPFDPKKDTVGGDIGSIITEDIPEAVASLKYLPARLKSDWKRAAPLRDPNVMFPFTTQGRAGDISFTNTVAPIASKTAEGLGKLWTKGGAAGKLATVMGGPPAMAATIGADVVGTGVSLGLDAFGVAINSAREALRAEFGDDPSIDWITRMNRAMTTDRSAGAYVQGKLSPKLEKVMIAQIKAGVDPEKAARDMEGALAKAGLEATFAEEAIIQGLFFAVPYFKNLARRESRYNTILAQRAELRAVRAAQNLKQIAGKYLALPEPASGKAQRLLARLDELQAAPGPADAKRLEEAKGLIKGIREARKVPRTPMPQPVSGPVAGPGFIAEAPGFKRTIAGPVIEDVREIVSPKLVAARPSKGPIIDIKGKASGPIMQSRESLLADAAQEPMRRRVRLGAIESKFVQEQGQHFGIEAPQPPRALPPDYRAEQIPDAIAGKGFIVERAGEKLPYVKAPRNLENIIEKSARQGPPAKSVRELALDRAEKKPPEELGGALAVKPPAPEPIVPGEKLPFVKAPKAKNVLQKAAAAAKEAKEVIPEINKPKKIKLRLSDLGKKPKVEMESGSPKYSTPGGKAAMDAAGKEESQALDDVIDFVSYHEPSQLVKDAEGNYSRLAGGFPMELGKKGYKTKDLQTVADKVKAGKPLTPRQQQIHADMMAVSKKMKGQAGFAKPFGEPAPRKVSEAERLARVERAQRKLDVIKGLESGELSEEGVAKAIAKESKSFLDKPSELPKFGAAANKVADVTIKDDTVARGINVGQLVKEGKITEEEAKAIVLADQVRKRIDVGKGSRVVSAAVNAENIEEQIANLKSRHKTTGVNEKNLRAAMAVDITEDMKVGSFPLGQKVAAGEITEQEARLLLAALKENPALNLRVPVKDSTRFATASTENVKEYLRLLDSMSPEETAILADVPATQAVRFLRVGLQQGKSIGDILDNTAGPLETLSKVAAMSGRTLRSFRNLRTRRDASELLRDMLKMKGVTSAQRSEILRQLELIGDPKGAGIIDWITEFGINSMLGARITLERNLLGGVTGLAYQIPIKTAQALISNIGSILHIPMKERVYFREIIPELTAMLKTLPVKAPKKGFRYFAYEDTVTILRNLEDELNQLRKTKIVSNPTSEQIVAIKQAIQTAKDKFKVAKKSGISENIRAARQELRVAKGTKVLRGQNTEAQRIALGKSKLKRVREIKEEARDLLTEEDLTRRAEIGRLPGRSIPGKFGFAVNIPVKTLVATDKALQSISTEGHKAAMLVRKAIKDGSSRNPFKTPSIRNMKLTSAEIEQAKTDALFYVFREQLGPVTGGIQKAISSIPTGTLFMPFFKSNTNFIKFAVKTSPFGAINAVRKSFGKGTGPFGVGFKLDTKESARALGGSLISMALYDYIKKNNGELHGPAKDTNERDLLRMLNKGEIRIDWKKSKTDDTVVRVTPLNNIAPLTIPFLVGAVVEEYHRNEKKGMPESDNFKEQANRLWKGLLQQSTYSNVNDLMNSLETLDEIQTAITASGDPDGERREVGIIRWINRFASGRTVSNMLREARQTGKLWGIIPIGEKDLRILEPRGFIDEVRSSLPRIGKFDPAGKIKAGPFNLTPVPERKTFRGDVAKRQERLFPSVGIIGDKPSNHIERDKDGNVVKLNPIAKHFGYTPNPDRVLNELDKYKVFPKRAPSKLTLEGIPIKLTAKEQREFNFLGSQLNEFLDLTIQYDPEYKGLPDLGKKKYLEQIVSEFRNTQAEATKYEGLQRLLSSDEGFKQMWYGLTEGFDVSVPSQ